MSIELHPRPGRRGHDVLLRNGITTSRHMEDAYWDKGAGYFVMEHGGWYSRKRVIQRRYDMEISVNQI